MNTQDTAGIKQHLLSYLKPYSFRLAGLVSLSVLAAPIALCMPLPIKMIVDHVIGSVPVPEWLTFFFPQSMADSKTGIFILSLSLLLFFTLLNLLVQLGSWVLGESLGEKITLDLRGRLFDHAQRLSLVYHDAKGISEISYGIQNDATSIHGLVITRYGPLISATAVFVSMILVTAQISFPLAMVALAVSPVIIFLTRFHNRLFRKQWEATKQAESAALSVVEEVLGAIRVVKSYHQEKRETDRFLTRYATVAARHVLVKLTESSLGLLVGMALAVGTCCVLFIGVRQVQAGILTLGNLLLVVGYVAQLYGPLTTIGNKLVDQQDSLVSLRRAFSLLEKPPEVIERSNNPVVDRVAGAIRFRDVSFGFRNEQPVFRHTSFDIPAGTRVGIAGPTGVGKTTLIALLSRFYDPMEGEILLDGVDLRDYKLNDLRRQFAIVPQESVLFSTCIAENIAYARPDARMDEIILAAKAANAHDFIDKLPEGYQTTVGVRGMSLSAGERQRIALARAFLKDAPVLIMDEPTSSIDHATESAIMEAIDRLVKNRTSIIVAHRLNTLKNCDLRIEFIDGRLQTSFNGSQSKS
jgi:ATP-binding cassette, subfamily B, bacterial